MKRRWFLGGKRIIINGKQSLCEQCPNYGNEMFSMESVYEIDHYVTYFYSAHVPINSNKVCWRKRGSIDIRSASLAYNGTYFIIVEYSTTSSAQRKIYTSTNLNNWEQITTLEPYSTINNVQWLAGRWVQTAGTNHGSWYNYYPRIYTSANGIDWLPSEEAGRFSRSHNNKPFQDESNNIYYYGAYYSSSSNSWNSVSRRTINYYDWEDVDFNITNPPEILNTYSSWNVSLTKVIRANGKYYGICSCVYGNPSLAYCHLLVESSNAVNWTNITFPDLNMQTNMRGLAYNGYIFVLLYNGYVYTSPDMSNWIQRTHRYDSRYLQNIEWDSQALRFVLTTNYGYNPSDIYTSIDGINWTTGSSSSKALYGLKNMPYAYPPIGGE